MPSRYRSSCVAAGSAPKLQPFAKMRHDTARDRWTILAPERVFTPDAVALAVLKLCDGQRTVDQIARELAKSYSAPEDRILKDVVAMLQELADKGVLSA